MDLTVDYMGLTLSNPITVGASPLSDSVDVMKRMEDAGAAAVVMHSLFMEQIAREQIALHYNLDVHEDSHVEALSYFPQPESYLLGPQEYLLQVTKLKEALGIPVIASLNGIVAGDWVHYAQLIQEAGADGIELNVYYLPLYETERPGVVEDRYLSVLKAVKQQVDIPVAMKLNFFLSSPIYTAQRLAQAGASGLVLFNRLFDPDIDIEELEVKPTLHLSSPGMLKLRMLWTAAMFGRVDASLAITGGVRNYEDIIKAVMSGANVVQMTSALLKGGSAHLAATLSGLTTWLEEHEYESVKQMHGSMSLLRCPDPEAFERANYMRTLQAWKPHAQS